MRRLVLITAPLLALCFVWWFRPGHSLYYQTLRDLTAIPQNGSKLVEQLHVPPPRHRSSKTDEADFRDRFFSIWDAGARPKAFEERKDQARTYQGCFSENLRRHSAQWAESLIANANFPIVGSLRRKGMILSNADLRGLPTIQPCFRDPRIAGEGYPFDRLQLTHLYVGTPVLVSHLARDGQWAFIATSFGDEGWIPISAFGYVDSQTEAYFRKSKLGVLTRDNLVLLSGIGRATVSSHIGMVLPYIGSEAPAGRRRIGLPVARGSFVGIQNVELESDAVLDRALELERSDLSFALDLFLGQPYGWGNTLGNRDCSGLIRDFYLLFHRVLPPSSTRLLSAGERIEIGDKSNQEKRALLARAIPFRTLLYRKGHVAIYLGARNGEPLIFHSLWGLKVPRPFQEGRLIVGAVVATSLDPGAELPVFLKAESLLSGVTDLIVLPEAPSSRGPPL